MSYWILWMILLNGDVRKVPVKYKTEAECELALPVAREVYKIFVLSPPKCTEMYESAE